MLRRPILPFALAAPALLPAQPSPPPQLPELHQSIVITATPLGPAIEPRTADVFRETLFSRDDHILQLLGAGIDAGQHEGGGKSLEIRRFGFNLDHGGLNGGLRILVDNVPQNHATQGHGQGYLGALKTLSPELVHEVNLINGPFSAEHGDFSGLGVIEIRQRETMPDRWTARFQYGSYDTWRGFAAWSPRWPQREAVFAYEGAYANGPFLRPLRYRRDNLTGSSTWRLSPTSRLGLKWNGGLNRFNSSGQLPLDEVAAGRLDPYGYLSEGDGGRVMAGRLGGYYRRAAGASIWKLDAFAERTLFDLYSNFTFYLRDPLLGDAIQQHDSRLRQGTNLQYLRPQSFSFGSGILTLGGNYLGSQNRVDLRQRLGRNPLAMWSDAHANVQNGGGYLQQTLEFAGGRLQIGGGLRFDVFRYGVQDHLEPELSGAHTVGAWQPKAFLSFLPARRAPLKLFFHYGRGIASIDARGAVRNPGGPLIARNDFYQAGASSLLNDTLAIQADLFLIDASHQIVYVPDDGTVELAGPSRACGLEAKSSIQLTRRVSFDAGLTKVFNAWYRGLWPRRYVDRAPHFVVNAALTVSPWRQWSGSLRARAINHYRLDPEDPAILASGHTVFDLAINRRLSRNLDFNLAVDNLLDRFYWETQNYFESRLPAQPPVARIHATPAYGRTVVVGLTLRLGGN